MGLVRLAVVTGMAMPLAACALYDGASSPTPSTTALTTVAIDLCDDATYFAFRDGSGAWQALAPNPAEPKTYSIQVTSTYEWLTVIASQLDGFTAELHGATIADGTSQHPVCALPRLLNEPVAITGQMMQAGTVRYGQVGMQSSAAGWDIDMQAPGGMHDLLVYDAASMYVQRGLQLWQATSLGAIDLSQTGSAMPSESLQVTGAGSDGIASYVVWQLGDRDPMQYVAEGSPVTIPIPPPTSVMSEDSENITVAATGPGDDTAEPVLIRSAVQPFLGTPTSLDFALPTGMSASFVPGDVTAAQWQVLPANPTVALYVDNENDPTVPTPSSELVSVSTSWIAATGASGLAFDTSAPGYNPSWNIDITRPYEADMRVQTGDAFHLLDTYQQFNAARARVHDIVLRNVSAPTF
jgi:hypothetical protein